MGSEKDMKVKLGKKGKRERKKRIESEIEMKSKETVILKCSHYITYFKIDRM